MIRALTFLAGLSLGSAALAAEIDDGGQLIPTDEIWDFRLALEGAGAFPDGLRVGDAIVRRLRIAPGGLVGLNEVPAGGPQALEETEGVFLAPFWAQLHVGPCANGQPPGERRWARTPDGVRFVWLNVPLAGCPDGDRASFTVELAASAGGRLSRIEYRYGVLPDGAAIEPRAGLVSPLVAGGALELFPDEGARSVRGRAKLLLSHSSDGDPGVWVIELDARGALVGDDDGDGVRGVDNCAATPNPRQFDIDGDRDGDACDIDIDGDGILQNEGDNCVFTHNQRQEDQDGDGIGDHCDDGDGDRIVDALDACPRAYDPAQLDLDRDGTPDACDSDIDGDLGAGAGWWSPMSPPDGCPYIWTWSQSDRDKDGVGDACDLDPGVPCAGFGCLFQIDADGDGIPSLLDACPTVPDAAQPDGDGDHIGDACDADMDGDDIPDVYRRAGIRCDPAVCPR